MATLHSSANQMNSVPVSARENIYAAAPGEKVYAVPAGQQVYTTVPSSQPVATETFTKALTTPSKFHGFVWFIIIFLILAVLFFFLKPGFVSSIDAQTGATHIDWLKLIIWSAVIAIVIAILIYFLFFKNRSESMF